MYAPRIVEYPLRRSFSRQRPISYNIQESNTGHVRETKADFDAGLDIALRIVHVVYHSWCARNEKLQNFSYWIQNVCLCVCQHVRTR